jgi:hypothetical protein
VARGQASEAEFAFPQLDCLRGAHSWDVIRGKDGRIVQVCIDCGELPARNLGLVLPRRKPVNDRVCAVYGHDWEQWASTTTGLYSYCLCCGLVAEEMALETDPRTRDTVEYDPISDQALGRYTPAKISAKIERARTLSTSAPALVPARSGSTPCS